MEMNSATVIAAWWGAIVATLAFLWEVFRWLRTGPRIQVKAQADMKAINIPGYDETDTIIIVEVINIGDVQTTITNVGAYVYDGLISRLKDRPQSKYVLVGPNSFGPPIPHVLDVGKRWQGGIKQSQFDKTLITEGNLYAVVCHTLSKKPVLAQVT